MLRELRIAAAPRALLERSGAELVPLPRPDLCCGFGGTFSVRQPEVSVAMADEKLAGAAAADALVTADPGCLMHLRGRAARISGPRVLHLATVLARGA
jgi:L-lactate dehydrogenase complex protein LldE